jgi:hypothetical protein
MSTIAGDGQARAWWQALSALKGMSGVELSLGSGIDNFEREREQVLLGRKRSVRTDRRPEESITAFFSNNNLVSLFD